MKVTVCDRCGASDPQYPRGWYRLTLSHAGDRFDINLMPGRDVCPQCMEYLAERENWMVPA